MVAVSEVLEVLKQPTETCEVLGKTEVREMGLLDTSNPKAGIYVMYGGGDRCTNSDNHSENGFPRKSRFKIYCAEKQDENVNFYKKFISLFLIYLVELKGLLNAY